MIQCVMGLLGLMFLIWAALMIGCWIYIIVLGILSIPVMILEGFGNLWGWMWKGRKA
jgi:hypothetical protein